MFSRFQQSLFVVNVNVHVDIVVAVYLCSVSTTFFAASHMK